MSASAEIHFEVVASNPNTVTSNAWEETTGLLSSLIPQTNGSEITDPRTFNASKGDLKLGPMPISEELQTETERVLREQAMVDRDPNSQYDVQWARPAAPAGVISPNLNDMLPHPISFQTVDVKREAERVRDARKRIRLEPSALANAAPDTPQGAAARSRALPSICAYTLHDVGEG
jgi:transcription initiation factor TFIID subunit 5